MGYPRRSVLILLFLLLFSTRAGAVGGDVFVTTPFLDVGVGDAHMLDFAVLAGLDIMGGYGDGTVRPDDHVTWAALARVSVALMGRHDLAERYGDTPVGGGEPPWTWGWINAAVSLGVLEPGVQWDEPVSWGEAAVGILRTRGLDLGGPVELHLRRITAAGIADDIPADIRAPVTRAQLAGMARRQLEDPQGGTILEVSEDRVILDDGRKFALSPLAVLHGYLPGDPEGVQVQLWLDPSDRVAVVATPHVAPRIQAAADSAVVLTYHHLTLSEPRSSAEIHVDDFRRQMEYLVEGEYQVLTLGEFVEYHGTGGFPERSVLLTFDDGYRSFYTDAYPVLVEYELPVVMFPIVSRRPGLHVGHVNFEHFSFAELRSMVTESELVDVGSHSYDLHHYRDTDGLPAIAPGEGEDAERYRWRVTRDLRLSRDLLAEQTGQEIDALAWPFGVSTETAVQAALSLGFQFIFDTEPGVVTPETCLLRIPRFGITSGCIDAFAGILEGALLAEGGP